MIRIKSLFAAALAASSIGALAVPAASVNYVFSHSNTAGFADTPAGTLKIEQIGADTLWTLNANWNNQFNASNPFVFGLDFSVKPGTSVNESGLPLSNVIGQVGIKSFSNSGVFFTPANNTNRFTDGEQVSWTFHNTNISGFVINDLHVNAIYNGASIKFGAVSPVAEPETYAMLLAGLGLMGTIARRRKPKNTAI
jgi:hypothetical protein